MTLYKLKKYLLGLTCLFSIHNSFAEGPYYPSYYVVCNTHSNGYQFAVNGTDPLSVRQSVQRQCQASSSTNNADCITNTQCNDNGQSQSMVTMCTSNSNGRRFAVELRDPIASRTEVKRICQADSSTNNADCVTNIQCNDGGYSKQQVSTCRTHSNGRRFAFEEIDPQVARNNAKDACKRDSNTNNADCITNLICENDRGLSEQLTLCKTNSNGRRFAEEGFDYYRTSDIVRDLCQRDSSTNNSQCVMNLVCNRPTPAPYPNPIPNPYPNPYPNPIPNPYPVPAPSSCVANRYDPAGRFIQSYSARDCHMAMSICNSSIRGAQFCRVQ